MDASPVVVAAAAKVGRCSFTRSYSHWQTGAGETHLGRLNFAPSHLSCFCLQCISIMTCWCWWSKDSDEKNQCHCSNGNHQWQCLQSGHPNELRLVWERTTAAITSCRSTMWPRPPFDHHHLLPVNLGTRIKQKLVLLGSSSQHYWDVCSRKSSLKHNETMQVSSFEFVEQLKRLLRKCVWQSDYATGICLCCKKTDEQFINWDNGAKLN